MYLHHKISLIKTGDRVLEIGPGSEPYPRADVYLDKKFKDGEREAQRGFAKKITLGKPVVWYDGGQFPFKDKEFDYVVCSHVLEHVVEEELELFISEIQRVAKRGYIEFPNLFYELINYQDVHIWWMNYKNGTILLCPKNKFKSNWIHKSYREMFYAADGYMKKAFGRYSDFFFCGVEWKEKINFKIVKSLEELGDENVYAQNKLLFSGYDEKTMQVVKSLTTTITSIAGSCVVAGVRMYKRLTGQREALIAPTVKLEGWERIKIGTGSEIKDYVIIRANREKVTIGRDTQINPFTVIYGGSGVTIGNRVLIAPHCVIASGNHDYGRKINQMRFAPSTSKGPIVIEDDVWIGANCTITDGIIIGKGAVIGANSVVTHNVEPYQIVGGVPAKPLNIKRK